MSAARLVLAEAAILLREGRIVAFPTETVYGLGADARSAEAVRRVFEAKRRPENNPMIVHVDGAEMARSVASEWPERAQEFAERFWPGPLTIVLPKADVIPGIVTGGGPTVGVRCPDHPLALELIRAFGGPLVGPSANPSGAVSPTRAEHVRAGLPGVPVLDGGPCTRGIESTVVAIEGQTARVLRPGVIGADELGATPYIDGKKQDAPLPAPGLLPSHYAPRAHVQIVPSSAIDAVPDDTGVLTHSDVGAEAIHHVALPDDAVRYAAGLYEALHTLDDAGVETILVEEPTGDGPIWDAVRDRLTRAAAPRS